MDNDGLTYQSAYYKKCDEVDALTAERDALEQEVERLKDGHCKDCCCARSWQALGVTGHTGMSIPEHIEALVERLALATAKAKAMEFGDFFSDKKGTEVLDVTHLDGTGVEEGW